MSTRRYRGRFAPSPTGLLHLGSARTALFAWARARAQGGEFLVRIEDLDGPRVVPGMAAAALKDLAWLGLDWDEGPTITADGALGDDCGLHGPYLQSRRSARYESALARLAAAGRTYPCTCTRKEIAAVASAPHGPEDEGPRYPGTCRPRPGFRGPMRPGRPAATRFVMDTPSPGFVDALCGEVPAGRFGEGDFVLRRADGVFAYQLAVVVDDLEMAVTEVVRGDDLLPSTPRQIALARALGAEPPTYLHLPLVVDARGERLGKRHRSTSLAALRAAGVRPEQVVGRLAASLGLRDGEGPMRARDVVEQLAAGFDLTRIGRAPTRVSEEWSGTPPWSEARGGKG